MRRKAPPFLCLALLWALFSACGGSRPRAPVLRVGFVPSENVQQVAQNAQPLIEVLQRELSIDVQPFVATDYTGVVEALRANKLDIAFLSPASYVLAKSEANIKVILKSHRKGSAYYYAAIITHRDSGIKALQDLRNKTFAFGDPLSTTGHIVPRIMLKQAGVDPARDFKQAIYSGGHDATVLAVLNRKVDGGATFANFPNSPDAAWMQYLKNPNEQRMIVALAYSEPIPADNLVVNAQLDARLAKRIEEVFVQLGASASGQKMLRELYQIDGFMPADDRDYDSVRQAFADAGIELKDALQRKRR